MKIGVISDTHVPDKARQIPQKILDDFKTVDMIIHAGDLVEPGVLEQLRSVCPDVRAVFGNMDPFELRARLPKKEIIQAEKFRVGVAHGYGHPDNLIDLMKKEFKNDKVDLIIFGHSHKPFNEKIDNIHYFNPGSATDEIFAPCRSYGIIEIKDNITAKIVKLDSE